MINLVKSQLDKPVESQSPFFRLVASPLERLYAWGVHRRNRRFDEDPSRARRLPGKTLSIGNLAVGGTGKSPVTVEVVKLLAAMGVKPAVLTRGYGVRFAKGDGLVLLAGKVLLPPRRGRQWSGEIPDEARMMSVALPQVPIVVGPDRYEAAQRFLADAKDFGKVTHWVLDDGFQHRQLARDMDIVLLDARSPFGNGKLLPQGNLRETRLALQRASMVIFTRCERGGPRRQDVSALERLFSGLVVYATFVTRLPAGFTPADEPALLCSGIARPDVLREALTKQGVVLGQEYLVNDHATFRRGELLRLAQDCRSVITTAKDYWRDPGIFADLPIPLRLLDLGVIFESEALREALAQFAK